MIQDMLRVSEHPQFQWLFEDAKEVGDAVWIADSPMPLRSEWPSHHLIDDFVGGRLGRSKDDPRPAASGPRIITGDWNRATITCVFPLEFASHGVNARPPGKEMRDIVLSVAAAYEFGLGTENHLSRGSEVAVRFVGYLQAQDVPRFVAGHGGPEGIGHYIDDVLLLARGGDETTPVTERTVQFTTTIEEDLERQLQLVTALLESQITALEATLEAEGLGRTEIIDRIADASSWSRQRIEQLLE